MRGRRRIEQVTRGLCDRRTPEATGAANGGARRGGGLEPLGRTGQRGFGRASSGSAAWLASRRRESKLLARAKAR